MPDSKSFSAKLWPLARQLKNGDVLGLGESAASKRTESLAARTKHADKVVGSVCPYCAVGCGQLVYVKDEKIIDIEGDPGSPISHGCLCPKGAATFQLVTGSHRVQRRSLSPAARHRVGEDSARAGHGHGGRAREENARRELGRQRQGRRAAAPHHGDRAPGRRHARQRRKLPHQEAVHRRSASFRSKIRPVFDTPPRSPVWGPRSDEAAQPRFQQDLQNSDCIVIEGSNMAECHPVGFRWVMKARERGATIIHVDPRFTRTSAVADIHVPIRAGTDIAFLGGIIHYILENERYFKEYVVNYTNAPAIINDEFKDTEDLDGLFSGWDQEKGKYDTKTWMYEDVDPEPAGGTRESKAATRQADSAQPIQAEHTDPTLQHPRCVFQILKRHFARYTPEMVEETCGIPQQLVPESRRNAVQELGPRARPALSATRSAGRSTRSACSTSARPRSFSCCSATWAGPAAASWRCAGTPPFRAPPIFRRSTTCCPAICRCRRRSTIRISRPVSAAERHRRPAGGASFRSTPSRC